MTGQTLRFGCQTYTWLMSGKKYKGQIPHILRVGRAAGFAGLEPEVVMLGDLTDPILAREAVAQSGIALSAICLVHDWLGARETEEEKASADHYITFLKHFPGTMFVLCQMPGLPHQGTGSDLRTRQENVLACVNAVAERANGHGIPCTYHPNSPEGSVFRTADDYEVLLNGLGQDTIGYAPDSGHIARGGMDPLQIVKRYRSRVNHVHFKDMFADKSWAPMGQGVIDFQGIVTHLAATNYKGWIMVEDECTRAEVDPDAATVDNGRFVNDVLVPLAGRNNAPLCRCSSNNGMGGITYAFMGLTALLEICHLHHSWFRWVGGAGGDLRPQEFRWHEYQVVRISPPCLHCVQPALGP